MQSNKSLDVFLSATIMSYMQTKPLYREIAKQLSDSLERIEHDNSQLKAKIADLDTERNKLISRLNENTKDEKKLAAALALFRNDAEQVSQAEQSKPEANVDNRVQGLQDLANILDSIFNAQNIQKKQDGSSFTADPRIIRFWM